jgi:hypothetical protein
MKYSCYYGIYTDCGVKHRTPYTAQEHCDELNRRHKQNVAAAPGMYNDPNSVCRDRINHHCWYVR